jgi:regulator of sigma E protease
LIESPNLLWTILFFVLAIAPLVFIHEMGHYLVGRWCGVKAEAFSIGFGRAVAKWTDKRGTEWRVGWLPLGGYVRFKGDMGVSSREDPEWLKLPSEERNQTFQSKALWQRSLIVLAGPVTNFLLAIVMLIGLFSFVGEPRTTTKISAVEKNSAAASAGLRVDDRIISVDGTLISDLDDLLLYVQPRANKQTIIQVDRGSDRLAFTMTPRLGVITDVTGVKHKVGQIGVRIQPGEFVKLPFSEMPTAATNYVVQSVKRMAVGLSQIVVGHRSVKELGGPVKIATTSNAVAKLGLVTFLFFVVAISINLGFINLLPIPMLDGGHLAFYAIEAVRRKPVSAAAQEWAYRSGLFVVLLFMVVVTVNDLAGLGLWRGIAGLIG